LTNHPQQPQSAANPIYQLGRLSFVVINCADSLQIQLRRMLPEVQPSLSEPVYKVDARLEEIVSLRDLINHMYKQHLGFFWLLGASVVSPAGQKVLISGPGHSGKSTTVLALCCDHDWKVVSEDITLFDLEKHEILNFASPFTVRIGTLELLDAASTKHLTFPEDEPWVPLGAHNLKSDITAPFDLSFYFDGIVANKALHHSELSHSEYLKLILPISNLARLPGAVDKIESYFPKHCYRVVAGSVRERVSKIIELCESSRLSGA
jgi:hypothetical protein